jgi:hypothetical protein
MAGGVFQADRNSQPVFKIEGSNNQTTTPIPLFPHKPPPHMLIHAGQQTTKARQFTLARFARQ